MPIIVLTGRRAGTAASDKIQKEVMSMNLNGTKTQANLMAAFAGESQASNKYTYYASKAKKEGYNQISDLFYETAENEKAHAELWFKLLQGGEIHATTENLKDAAAGENFEHTKMYKQMAQDARAEGFDAIAQMFEAVGRIEKHHEERYLKLLANIENGEVFRRDDEQAWYCTNCGHVHYGKNAPEVCPVCAHPQAYFEIKKTNF